MIFSIPVLLSIYSNLLVFSSFSLILKIYGLCCYCILGENVIFMSYFNARLLIFLVFFLYFCFWFQTIDNAWPIFLNKRMALRKGEWISKNNEKWQTFQQSQLFILFLNGHLSEASVTDSKYIKMTRLQDFY